MNPQQPLDQEEAQLAKVLRTLPGAAPSAELDQRVMRAAREAVRPPRRRTWHWASAAAAALALMVSAPQWRPALYSEAEPAGEETSLAPGASSRQATGEARDAEAYSESIESIAEGSADAARPAPAPAPAAAPRAATPPSDASSAGRPREAAAAKSVPAPAADSALREAFSQRLESEAVPALTPDQLLQEIAELQQQGREDEARRLLRELLKAHPELRIPEPLRPLLKESER